MNRFEIITALKERFWGLQQSAGFRKYFFNTGWLFADQVLRLLVGLLVGIYVARYLEPERYGILSYAGSFVGLFAAFSTLGLDSIVVRELVKDPTRREQLLGTAFRLQLAGSGLLFLLVMIAVQFADSDRLTRTIIAILALATLFDPFNIINLYFQATVQSKFTAMASIITLVVGSVFRLALIAVQSGLFWFVLASVLEKLVLAGGYVFFFTRRETSLLRWQFQGKLARSLLKDSWPLILSSMSIMIYMRIDQVLLKALMNAEAVGLYAVAVRLSELWYFVPMTITASLFPAILNVQTNHPLYLQRLQRLYDLMVFISVGVAIVITVLGPWVVAFLYGSAYAPAGSTLMILVWAGVFVSLGVANSNWLIAENLTRVSMINTTLGAILNIALNLWLIPWMGINGAALATVISYFCSAYLFLLLHKNCLLSFRNMSRALFIPGAISRALHSINS